MLRFHWPQLGHMFKGLCESQHPAFSTPGVIVEGGGMFAARKKVTRNGWNIATNCPCSQPVKIMIVFSISQSWILTSTNQSFLYMRKICVAFISDIALLFLSKINIHIANYTTNQFCFCFCAGFEEAPRRMYDSPLVGIISHDIYPQNLFHF